MRMVRPKLDAPQVSVAEHQEEFKPVTAAMVRNAGYDVDPACGFNTLVLAFRPTPRERERLAAGADVYLSLLTFGGPMQGVILSAGPEDPAAMFGVRLEDAPDEPPPTEDEITAALDSMGEPVCKAAATIEGAITASGSGLLDHRWSLVWNALVEAHRELVRRRGSSAE